MPVNSATLILAATDHLAHELRAAASLQKQQAGERVWEAPQIDSLQQWVRQQWADSWPVEQLLHPVQELALWRQAVEQDSSLQLLSPLAAARMARSAEQLALQYQIQPQQLQDFSVEQQAFKRWWQHITKLRKDKQWLAAAQLPAAVTELVKRGEVSLPERLLLQGFTDAHTPSEQALLDAMKTAGVVIEYASHLAATSPLQLRRYASAQAQYDDLAQRLAAFLAPCANRDTPPPRLLVALPDADSSADLLEVSLRRELAPWLGRADERTRPLPWRFAKGPPLAQQPIVALALAIAALPVRTAIALEGYSPVLLNLLLWPAQEQQQAELLDYRLRKDALPRYSPRMLLQHCPDGFKPRWQALLAVLEAEPRSALPSSWCEHWQQRMQALGLPPAGLDSASFQAYTDWQEATQVLATLDAQLGKVSAAAALTWLREIVGKRPFTARVEYQQPIQIVSYAEVAGIPCEQLFVLNANDDCLPASGHSDPFLPRELLASAGMPQASPALRLQQAQRRIQAWQGQCQQLHVTACKLDAAGVERLPSQLFGAAQPWPDSAAAIPEARPPLCQLPAADPVPAVTDPMAEGIRGGTGLFAALAEAPFYAFCIGRLGLEPFPQPGLGLDARRQGDVLHEVLASLWEELGNSAALAALSDAAVAEHLESALQLAMQRHIPAAAFGKTLLASEHARLASILQQWLAHERRRIAPFSVLLREQEVAVDVLGLHMQLRIDRVDAVSVGGNTRYLIMDYKSGSLGSVDPSGWNSNKLSAPQLPLYATLADLPAVKVPQVDGICFAHLRDGHPALQSRNNWCQSLIDAEPGKYSHDWDEQLELWRQRFHELLHGFLAGDAGLPEKLQTRSYRAWLLPLANRNRDEDAA